MIEYTPKPCFKPFGDAVSNARRAGDADPSKAIIADTMKLVGNSSYGKTITNKERHRQVKFCDDDEVPNLINSPFFRELSPIDDDTYEVQSSKKKIKLDLPLQVGFFVYQYAKLRMLQFYYDFLDKYVDRSDFEYCEMDSDSAYIAISGESLEDLVKPEMMHEFENDKCNWFPRTDTVEHAKYDQGRREGGARGATCPGPQPKGGPDLRDETKFPIVYCDMTSPLTPIYNRSLYREENVAWQIVLL